MGAPSPYVSISCMSSSTFLADPSCLAHRRLSWWEGIHLQLCRRLDVSLQDGMNMLHLSLRHPLMFYSSMPAAIRSTAARFVTPVGTSWLLRMATTARPSQVSRSVRTGIVEPASLSARTPSALRRRTTLLPAVILGRSSIIVSSANTTHGLRSLHEQRSAKRRVATSEMQDLMLKSPYTSLL